MKRMHDFPWDEIGMGEQIEFKLDEDYLLDDSAFSDKNSEIALKGETVVLTYLPNFGLVKHPVHGDFRY